ncbi:MAG: response regulator [Candidatus Paceibacterota bacterium]|jgi:two-component system alkaline phosphatase synthesis response regulator PhoP
MKKNKILLVEDDEVLSKVVYEELTEADFDVSQAFDGESGLLMAHKEQPDLVLLDILLPKKDGFDILSDLKKSSETKDLPVIMLTMLGSDDDIKRGLQLGANDYIVKSQHALPEIIEKVKTFFAKGEHLKINKTEVN